MYHCAISGQPPKNPVLSKKSGHLFDKSLIEKYIDLEGKCPVTGEPLAREDLVAVVAASATRPRPVDGAGVPGLLSLLQNEWDDAMLEIFLLKKHLDQTRKELSQSLYQQDAAGRVIARLVRERDEARSQLQMQRNALAQSGAFPQVTLAAEPGAANGPRMDVEVSEEQQQQQQQKEGEETRNHSHPQTLPSTIVEEISKKWTELSQTRKKRKLPPGHASAESIAAAFGGGKKDPSWSITLHKTKPAGITCFGMNSSVNKCVTGGADKTVIVYNITESKQEGGVLLGHSKQIVDVNLSADGSLVLSASLDGTARVWRNGTQVHSFFQETPVMSASFHPIETYIAFAAANGTWSMCDILNQKVLACAKTPLDKNSSSSSSGLTCGRFHPDGRLYCTGSNDAQLHIWDCNTMTSVHAFKELHSAPIQSLSFSENGYYLASGDQDGVLHLWDLRKMKSIQNFKKTGPIKSVAFDDFGNYLAAADATSIDIFVAKGWKRIGADAIIGGIDNQKMDITGLAFGQQAKSLYVTSLDRKLRCYELD